MNRTLTYLLCIAALALGITACRKTPTDNAPEAFPFRTSADSGWGLMATDGSVQVAEGTFADQPSAVVGDMFCVTDSTGCICLYNIHHPDRPVSAGRFSQVGYFFAPVAVARQKADGLLCLINKQGEVTAPLDFYPDYRIEMAHNVTEGRVLIATDQGKFGFCDTNGKLTVPPVYDFASDYADGKAVVGKASPEGQLGFFVLDTDGKIKAALRQVGCAFDTRFADGLLVCRFHSGQCGALDERGETRFTLPDSILTLERFRYGTGVIRTASGVGTIDTNGREVLPCRYRDVVVLSAQRLALSDGNEWILADKKGKTLAQFQTCPVFLNESGGAVHGNGQTQLITPDGNAITTVAGSLYAAPEALRMKPEVFVRTLHREQTESEVQPESEDAPAPQETEQPTPARRGTTIGQADWKNIARGNPFYQEAAKVISGKLSESDAANRRMILNYVEHLRTSYTTKDIDFLNQLFSDDALIIVGHVVSAAPRTALETQLQKQVQFSVKTKRDYLEQLRKVFQANKQIDVQFSDFRIHRHPSSEGIYGVTLHQKYKSDRYADDGWLFLLWDFRDKDAPKIHVRTWQPGLTNEQTPLPESEVISIGQFNLN